MKQEPILPDDGTPLHALAELRRVMGERFDSTSADVMNAIDRAQGAVIQADSAKTLQEEIRHLIRALAAVAQTVVLAPKHLRDAHTEVFQKLEREVATLALAIPRMPATPDEVA